MLYLAIGATTPRTSAKNGQTYASIVLVKLQSANAAIVGQDSVTYPCSAEIANAAIAEIKRRGPFVGEGSIDTQNFGNQTQVSLVDFKVTDLAYKWDQNGLIAGTRKNPTT